MIKPKISSRYIYNTLGLWIATIILCIFMGSCTSQQENSAHKQMINIYKQAHLAQDSASYPKALALYKECVKECASKQYEKDDSILSMLPKALVQIVNVYQSLGKPEECIAYFDSLRTIADEKQADHTYNIFRKAFKRDIHVLLAYSISRTDAEKEAALTMDTALSMPLTNPTPERKSRDYTYAAAVYYCVPTCRDKVLKYGRLALDEFKLCQQKSGATWLVSLMAKLYQSNGDVGKAIGMCREGFELAEMCKDTLGMANCKKDLADYLYQWELYDDADKYASEAISLLENIRNSNPMVATVAYTIKAKILRRKGKNKEAMTFLHKAKHTCETLPYNSGSSDVDLLMGIILISDTTKEKNAHFTEGMQLLKKVSQEATYQLRARAYLELAKASISHGDEAQGRISLDSMYAVLHTPSPPIMLDGAYEYALNYYIQKGDTKNIGRYSSALNIQRIAEGKAQANNKIAKSLARFEMDKQEQELARKMEEIEMRKSREIIAIVCIISIIACLATLFSYKRKKKHQEEAFIQQQLSHAKMTATKKQEKKPKPRITPQQLLALKDNKDFKSYFNKAYPHFRENLKIAIPQITTKDELYCMLIALKCNNEVLASTLNVARSSVVIAKYRIRKKLRLKSNLSLEDYLINLLRKEDEAANLQGF